MELKEDKDIMEKRGEIVTNFSYIEYLMKTYISVHYFKSKDHPIVSEIFEDEYFNFGLLFRIFEKILVKDNKNFPLQNLRRMGHLRNIVAHAILVGKAVGPTKEEIIHRYFKHGGVLKEIEETFHEYQKNRSIVEDALIEIVKPTVDVSVIP